MVMPVLTPEHLRRVGLAIFTAAGTPDDLARLVVDHLVDAHLAGHDSHGFIQVPGYVRAIREGRLQPAARPTVLAETATTARIDGCWAFGQVSARYATEVAIGKAQASGLALVALVRCTHIGRLGEYVGLASARGVVALVTVAGPGGDIVAPHGGRRGAFSTNPIAIGFPADQHLDLMVDFATSVIAGGKVMVAAARGETLPPGCLLDRDGNPTTDPADYFAGGALLPFGGHKGSALALVSALLGGVLTGAETIADGGDQAGTVILAIDAGVFRPLAEVRRSADRVLARIKAIPPANGFEEVLLPGEPEARARARRQREGIEVPETTWAEVRAAAASLGVGLP
jgi:uncharacterized oxidoreductase